MEKNLLQYGIIMMILKIVNYAHHCGTSQAGVMEITICLVLLYFNTSRIYYGTKNLRKVKILNTKSKLSSSKIIWSAHNCDYTRSKFKVILNKISDYNLFLRNKVSIRRNNTR